MSTMLGSAQGALETLSEEYLGLVKDFAHKLKSSEHEKWATEGRLFLRGETCWIPAQSPTSKVKKSLLTEVGVLALPGMPGTALARMNFVLNTADDAEVKFSYFDDRFSTEFLDMTMGPVEPSTLTIDRLTKASVDESIIRELGGNEAAKISLAEFFLALAQQSKGQKGPLLVNGYANIAYIKNKHGVLRAVHAIWFGRGWRVDAYPVENPYRWDDGYQILSCRSRAA